MHTRTKISLDVENYDFKLFYKKKVQLFRYNTCSMFLAKYLKIDSQPHLFCFTIIICCLKQIDTASIQCVPTFCFNQKIPESFEKTIGDRLVTSLILYVQLANCQKKKVKCISLAYSLHKHRECVVVVIPINLYLKYLSLLL